MFHAISKSNGLAVARIMALRFIAALSRRFALALLLAAPWPVCQPQRFVADGSSAWVRRL